MHETDILSYFRGRQVSGINWCQCACE